ncbi:MAG: SprB repeat-containing protein, partial [Bacteroidota bacterium]
MRNFLIFTFVFFFLFCFSNYAQNGLVNSGNNIIVSTGSTLKILGPNGNITNNNNSGIDGKIKNDGTIIIEGNWINNANNYVFVNLNSTGNVVLNGIYTQEIGGTGNSTKFENLFINNSASTAVEITGPNDQYIENKLTFIDGTISTNTNKLIISNPDFSSITGYNNTNFVFGHLRRYISNNTDTYAFPIGNGLTGTDYYLTEILNNNMTGTNYIDAFFGVLTNHIDIDMNVTESGMIYNSFGTEGVWFLTPDVSVTGGSFDLRCYLDNFSGLYDNRFALLSRQDNSLTAADWDCNPCGIGNPGINPDDGEGRLLSDGYALRQGYTSFSQFGIGKIDCQQAQLPADATICYGDSLILYPGSFGSYLWSTGSTDSILVIFDSGQYFVEVVNINPGCGTSSDTINLTVSTIDNTIIIQDISCHGYNDGKISIFPSGGTPDYHYYWDPAQADTSHITGLSYNSYTVTIIDANGCKKTIPKIQINEPDSLYITSDITNPICSGVSNG